MAIATRSPSAQIRGDELGDRSMTKGGRTRDKILFTAGRHFARRGYSAVTLKDIADDVGITPAMIVRYFGSKRALFEAVVHVTPSTQLDRMSPDELATRSLSYWQDPDLRTKAIALLRSLDLDGGELFQAELRNRITDPWSDLIRGPDADVRLRLVTGLLMGVGLFGLGTLLHPDQPPLPDEEIKRLIPYLARLLSRCLEPLPGGDHLPE
jgi:AcrR family transcriptional regulator